MLKEKINADIISAVKSGDVLKKDTLKVLKGEIERTGDYSDTNIMSTVKKMVKNIEESTKDEAEIAVLSVYLPSQLTQSEIEALVVEEIESNGYSSLRDTGKLINFFETNYSGRFDGKTVSNIFRSQLA